MTRFLVAALSAALFIASCATSPGGGAAANARGPGLFDSKPKNIDNICSIFKEKNRWIADASASYEKWGIPIELMMAIIRHESSFRAAARPVDKNGRRLSSAYGYSQAIDGTWEIYKRENNKPRAQRTSFRDAIDFVGWYSSKSISQSDDVSPFDVNALYVFYHDGWAALPEDGSRKLKSEVLEVAAKVYQRTLTYHRQLKNCPAITNALYAGGIATWRSDEEPRRQNKRGARQKSSNPKPQWF